MAVHEPVRAEWMLDFDQRTLDAIIACDMELIDLVTDETLARVEQRWRRETGRALVLQLPEFLCPLAARQGRLTAPQARSASP